MEEEIHFPFVIVHLSFGITRKSPNEYLALNQDRIWRCQMTNVFLPDFAIY